MPTAEPRAETESKTGTYVAIAGIALLIGVVIATTMRRSTGKDEGGKKG